MAPEALVFDLDGTLWKGYEWYAGILSQVTRHDAATLLRGLLDGQSVIALAERLSISRTRLLRLCAEKVHLLEMYPEVVETLLELRRRGVKLGIATDLSGRIVEPALNGLNFRNLFGVVVHAGSCKARKPSPLPLRRAVQGLEVRETSRLFYVGDSAKDAQCSGAAGVPFVWASYGYSSQKPEGTHSILKTFSEVLLL